MQDTGWLWAVFTLVASAAQTVRNATQRGLTATLGTVGATHVRALTFHGCAMSCLGLQFLRGAPERFLIRSGDDNRGAVLQQRACDPEANPA